MKIHEKTQVLVWQLFVWFFKTRVKYGFLQNPSVEGTKNRVEHKTQIFCQIYFQKIPSQETLTQLGRY
jgi:hypothetical protein